MTLAEDFERVGVYATGVTCKKKLAVERAISDKMEKALKNMNLAYVHLMEMARDRIMFEGGQCDPVTEMEMRDPHLRQSRAVLTEVAAIRNQEIAAVKTYCGGKPNYVSEEKA